MIFFMILHSYFPIYLRLLNQYILCCRERLNSLLFHRICQTRYFIHENVDTPIHQKVPTLFLDGTIILISVRKLKFLISVNMIVINNILLLL